MRYAGTPDFVLDGVVRALGALLPLFERGAGSVRDATLYSAYRHRVTTWRRDLRATARSTTLGQDLADVTAAYRASSADMRAVIVGLERIVGAARSLPLTPAVSGHSALARADVEWGLIGLVEWLAVAEMARAIAALDIDSHEEATALRGRYQRTVTLAIERASDRGAALVCRQLTTLGGLVARDLIERGRPLARLVSYETAKPLPAVVVAHKLYQDAGRADELMAYNPRHDHPAWMAIEGKALSR